MCSLTLWETLVKIGVFIHEVAANNEPQVSFGSNFLIQNIGNINGVQRKLQLTR